MNIKKKSTYFSGQCYKRQLQHPVKALNQSTSSANSNGTEVTLKKTQHSIRLVEIPWSSARKDGIRLSVDEHPYGIPVHSVAGCKGVRISE